MDKEPTDLKAGTIIALSSGSYSDYGMVGYFVVLRDTPFSTIVDSHSKSKEEIKRHEENGGFYEYGAEIYKIVSDLLLKGFLLEVDVREIHFGGPYYDERPEDYGSDPEWREGAPVNYD